MYSIPVEPRIFAAIKACPPGNYELNIPMDVDPTFVMRGIDGDSFVMFNPDNGQTRKVTPPFGRKPELVDIQHNSSTDRIYMNMRSVSPRLVDGAWHWSIQLAP